MVPTIRRIARACVFGLFTASVSATLIPSSAAELLYDNGAVVEADLGIKFNYNQWSVYDGFVISEDSIITGFEWSQFDEGAVNYSSTVLVLFNNVPTPSSLLTSFNPIATRTSNRLMLETNKVPSGEVFGFDYLVDGLNLNLPAGTYYLGIWNDVSGGATLIGTTFGAVGTTPGFYQQTSGGPPLFGLTNSGPDEFHTGNMSFRVNGFVAIPVTIDIKPGSDPVCNGAIPVAILGSVTLDVVQIDQTTLSFEGLDVRERGNGALSCNIRDANRDGFADLVCQYQDTTTEGTLIGELFDGSHIEGTDTFCVVGIGDDDESDSDSD